MCPSRTDASFGLVWSALVCVYVYTFIDRDSNILCARDVYYRNRIIAHCLESECSALLRWCVRVRAAYHKCAPASDNNNSIKTLRCTHTHDGPPIKRLNQTRVPLCMCTTFASTSCICTAEIATTIPYVWMFGVCETLKTYRHVYRAGVVYNNQYLVMSLHKSSATECDIRGGMYCFMLIPCYIWSSCRTYRNEAVDCYLNAIIISSLDKYVMNNIYR